MRTEQKGVMSDRATAVASVFAIVVVLASCVLVTSLLRQNVIGLRQGCEAQTEAAAWPEAFGRVVDTRIDRRNRSRSTQYQAIISYIYQTPQGPQGGNVLRFDESPWRSSESEARAMARPYRAGAIIKVKYNPERMHISLLDGSAPRWDSLRQAELVLWIVYGVWFVIAIYLAWKVRRWLLRRSRKHSPSDHRFRSPHIHKPK